MNFNIPAPIRHLGIGLVAALVLIASDNGAVILDTLPDAVKPLVSAVVALAVAWATPLASSYGLFQTKSAPATDAPTGTGV